MFLLFIVDIFFKNLVDISGMQFKVPPKKSFGAFFLVVKTVARWLLGWSEFSTQNPRVTTEKKRQNPKNLMYEIRFPGRMNRSCRWFVSSFHRNACCSIFNSLRNVPRKSTRLSKMERLSSPLLYVEMSRKRRSRKKMEKRNQNSACWLL